MSVLIVVLAAGLLTHFFPCCAFAIRSFSKVSATPVHGLHNYHPSVLCHDLADYCSVVMFSSLLTNLWYCFVV